MGPYAVASLGVVHFSGGLGDFQRFCPPVVAAKGMPRNAFTPFLTEPRSGPSSMVRSTGVPPASASVPPVPGVPPLAGPPPAPEVPPLAVPPVAAPPVAAPPDPGEPPVAGGAGGGSSSLEHA